jgi:hypothetical protein
MFRRNIIPFDYLVYSGSAIKGEKINPIRKGINEENPK